jgi:hypothetical protein
MKADLDFIYGVDSKKQEFQGTLLKAIKIEEFSR